MPGLIEDDVDQRLARFRIDLPENLRGDLDEVTVQIALVPFVKNFRQVVSAEAENIFQDRVGFADQLHVAVLDPVVDHLDVMAGAIRAHVTAARLAIHLRGDLAKDRRDNFPGITRTAGHERRAFQRAFFAAGNTAADEVQSAPFQILAAPLRVGEERVPAVDDHVAFFQERRELSDDRVHGTAGLHHDHRFAWTLQRADKFLHRPRWLDVFSFRFSGGKFLRDFPGPIEHGDGKSLGFHVEDEVLAHDGEADQSDITLIRAHFRISLITPAGRRRGPTLSGSNTAWQFPFAKSQSQKRRSICPRLTRIRRLAPSSFFGARSARRKTAGRLKASITKRIGRWPNIRCVWWRKAPRRSSTCARFFFGIGLGSSRRANRRLSCEWRLGIAAPPSAPANGSWTN